MKKSLLALAVAGAFSGAAFAQSSVTLFGIVDTNLQYLRGDGNGSVRGMGNNGIQSSRLGFRGSEDLGGGLKANFWMEAGPNSDDGSFGTTNTNNQAGSTGGGGLTFGRRMFVGLSGGFGEVRLGREYTPMFFLINANDPFGTNGVGDVKIYATTALGTVNPVQVRTSNGINYVLPGNLGGFYGHILYAFGENPSNAVNSSNGNTYGARIGWAGGPADVSGAYLKSRLNQTASQGDYTVYGIGGSYKIGNLKPMAQFVKHEVDTSAPTDPARSDWLLGLVWTVGTGEARFSFTRYDVKNTSNDAQQLAAGYVHNLSRRTALYGSYSMMDNKGTGTAFSNGRATTTPGGKTTGLQVGVRHTF